jgi:ubiquinone/menaquinone biosynthesis C-methylase UbiE
MFHPRGPTLRELAVQALSSTERGYDLLAPKFDYTPFRTPDSVLDAVAGALSRWAPFESALDLCCGTGAGMRMLRPLCRGPVVGLDRSRGMLEVGRETQLGAPGAAPLQWVRGEALALPLGTAFDLVVSFGAFGHIPRRDQPSLLEQVRRVLRPGGRFVFVTSTMPRPWTSRYWLARCFNGAMHVRNRLLSPPFVMYYLTFLLPEVGHELERQGLSVEVRPLEGVTRPGNLHLVVATAPNP